MEVPFDERQLDDAYWGYFSSQNCRTAAGDSDVELLRQFAADLLPEIVCNQIIAECGDEVSFDEADQECFRELGILARNLQKVRGEFLVGSERARLYRWYFPHFARRRQDSVDSLRVVADQMNATKFKCNVASVAGSSIGILGGGLMIAGAVSSVLTLGLAAPIALGGTMALLGTGSNVVASVAGSVVLKRNIQRAEDTINEDKQHYMPFSDWLANSREIKNAISSVMDINLMRRMVNDIATLFKETCSFKEKISNFTNRIELFVKIHMRPNGYAASNRFLLLQSLVLISGFLFSLACLKIQNDLLFTAGITALKLGLCSAIMLDVGVDAFTTALSSFNTAFVPRFLLPAASRNAPGFLSRVATAKQMLVSGLYGQASVVRDVVSNFSSGRTAFSELSDSAVVSGPSASAPGAVASGLSGQASLAGGVVSSLTRHASSTSDDRAAVSVSVGRVAARTTFMSSIDLKVGSEAEMVNDMADKLEDELWSLQNIFDEMDHETWLDGASEH